MSKINPILIVDFQNTVHRARAGFDRGEHSLTYTFFRMLRKDVETFAPSKVYSVTIHSANTRLGVLLLVTIFGVNTRTFAKFLIRCQFML